LRTLFFALYLIGSSHVVKIEPFENYITLVIGYVLYGLFHVATITILMSMLIAMMTKSYEAIDVNVDFFSLEYKRQKN
jgi:uncharacterized membrane protein